MQIQIDLELRPLTQMYKGLQAYLQNKQQLLRSMGETLAVRNADRHLKGVDPDGAAWKPLSSSVTEAIVQKHLAKTKRKNAPTAKAIAKATAAAGNRRVLWDSGRMLNKSLHPEVSSDAVTIGFDVAYAAYHHYGTSSYTIRPKNKQALKFNGRILKSVLHPGLPARPLLGFPEGDKQAVVSLLDENIRHIINSINRG
jgi:phage gpG-like protein